MTVAAIVAVALVIGYRGYVRRLEVLSAAIDK